MDIDNRPLFVTRKVFLRRLARRLMASALAMATLHVLSPVAKDEETPLAIFRVAQPMPEAAVDATERGSTTAVSPARAASATQPPPHAALERADRLRNVSADRGDGLINASRSRDRSGATVADVVIFHRCLPGCDSRDPQLASNRTAASDASPDTGRGEDKTLTSLAAGSVAVQATAEGSDGIVRAAYRNLRSLTDAGSRSIGAGIRSVSVW